MYTRKQQKKNSIAYLLAHIFFVFHLRNPYMCLYFSNHFPCFLCFLFHFVCSKLNWIQLNWVDKNAPRQWFKRLWHLNPICFYVKQKPELIKNVLTKVQNVNNFNILITQRFGELCKIFEIKFFEKFLTLKLFNVKGNERATFMFFALILTINKISRYVHNKCEIFI